MMNTWISRWLSRIALGSGSNVFALNTRGLGFQIVDVRQWMFINICLGTYLFTYCLVISPEWIGSCGKVINLSMSKNCMWERICHCRFVQLTTVKISHFNTDTKWKCSTIGDALSVRCIGYIPAISMDFKKWLGHNWLWQKVRNRYATHHMWRQCILQLRIWDLLKILTYFMISLAL